MAREACWLSLVHVSVGKLSEQGVLRLWNAKPKLYKLKRDEMKTDLTDGPSAFCPTGFLSLFSKTKSKNTTTRTKLRETKLSYYGIETSSFGIKTSPPPRFGLP